MNRLFRKKSDLILIIIVLAAALISGIYYKVSTNKPAVYAEISQDGTTIERLDLSKDTEITITAADTGDYNRFIVKDGEIWCEEASCPDKICVKEGHQSQNGSVIVCLPNKVIATIVDAK